MSVKDLLQKEIISNPSLKWLIGFELFTAACIISAMLFIGKREQDPPDPEFQKEMRKANDDLRKALLKQEAEAQKTIVFLQIKDSIMKNEFEATRAVINKQKKQSDEKINRINNYTSIELRRAFAEFDY